MQRQVDFNSGPVWTEEGELFTFGYGKDWLLAVEGKKMRM